MKCQKCILHIKGWCKFYPSVSCTVIRSCLCYYHCNMNGFLEVLSTIVLLQMYFVKPPCSQLTDIRVHLQYFIVSSLPVCWLPVAWLHSCSSVFVWDLRQMVHKKPKCLFSWKFEKSVSSAYYSPLTGNRLLLTSMDDRLRCEHSRRCMLVSSGSNLRFLCC